MDRRQQSIYAWTALALLTVTVGGYLVWSMTAGGDKLNFDSTVKASVAVVTEEAESGFGPEVADQNSSDNYESVRDSYEGRRIQLDNCVLLPNYVTYKNGTKIMLDNRSNEPTEIRIDGRPIRLWAYEYHIVTLYNSSVPHTVDFDCQYLGQDQYNVARVLLQP